jgi:hypothetical protein
MFENELRVIGLAVVNGQTVSGKFGSNTYSPVDLMGLSLETLDSIYGGLQKEKAALPQQSLMSRKLTNKENELESKLTLVTAVFTIKKANADAEKAAKEARAQKEKTLQLLYKAKELKEVEMVTSMSLEDLDKKITELTA